MKRNVALFFSTLAFSLITLTPVASAANCIHGASETPVCEGNWVYAVPYGSPISGEALEVFKDGKVKISDNGNIYWLHVSKVSPDVLFLNGLARGDCVHFMDDKNNNSTGMIMAVFANGLVEVVNEYKYFRSFSAVGKKTKCVR
jgi:hypothetical protein